MSKWIPPPLPAGGLAPQRMRMLKKCKTKRLQNWSLWRKRCDEVEEKRPRRAGWRCEFGGDIDCPRVFCWVHDWGGYLKRCVVRTLRGRRGRYGCDWDLTRAFCSRPVVETILRRKKKIKKNNKHRTQRASVKIGFRSHRVLYKKKDFLTWWLLAQLGSQIRCIDSASPTNTDNTPFRSQASHLLIYCAKGQNLSIFNSGVNYIISFMAS